MITRARAGIGDTMPELIKKIEKKTCLDDAKLKKKTELLHDHCAMTKFSVRWFFAKRTALGIHSAFCRQKVYIST